MNEVIYFAIPGIGIVLIAMGMSYEERVIGTLGAILLMIFGTSIFITPISGITDFQNSLLASVLFGLGTYVLLYGNLDQIEKVMP